MDSPPGSPTLGLGRESEEQEAKNAETLMRYVGEHVERNPSEQISEPSILKFYELLTHGINYPHNEPRRYRSHSVAVAGIGLPQTGKKRGS